MNREKGWKPLPVALKILFVIFSVSVLGFLSSLSLAPKLLSEKGAQVLGIHISGLPAIINFYLLGIALIALLIAMWSRYSWTWKYGIAYSAYGLLNSILSMVWFQKTLAAVNSQVPTVVNGVVVPQVSSTALVLSGVFGIIYGMLIMLAFYKNRSYFE